MMEDWQQIKLGEISQIYSGFAFRTQDFGKCGIPVIKIANIQNKRVKPECSDHFPEELCTEKLNRYFLQANDSLIAMTGAGSVGKVGKMPRLDGRFLVNQRVAIVRPDDSRCVPAFVYFSLSQDFYETKLYGLGLGAGQPNISAKQISELEIPFPPLYIQRRIAGILSVYDELIENSQWRIRILEEMARSLYSEWFVSENLPGSLKAQSPRKSRFGELCDLVKEPFSERLHSGRPLLDLSRMPQHSLAPGDTGAASELTTSRILFEPGDTLFGAIRCYLHKVNAAHFSGVTNTSVLVLRPKIAAFRSLVAIIASDTETIRWADTHSTGTKMPVINWGILQTMPAPFPSEDLAKAFEEVAGPMLDQIGVLALRVQNLRRTRDLLLPRLLSGQVSLIVPESEQDEVMP